jgi:hypothetical protein
MIAEPPEPAQADDAADIALATEKTRERFCHRFDRTATVIRLHSRWTLGMTNCDFFAPDVALQVAATRADIDQNRSDPGLHDQVADIAKLFAFCIDCADHIGSLGAGFGSG